ncbi:MAG: hypothetical protein WAN71_18320 [Mycobacterium sp.]
MALIGLAAMMVWPASACLADHRHDAELVDQRIKAMPGVADTELKYESSFENGQNFGLVVKLDTRVTLPQATDIGRSFVDQTQRHHLGGHKVELDIRYPAVPQQKSNYLADYSQAAFTLGDNASPPADPSAADVGDSIAVWLHAVRSPVAEYVGLNQPTWGGSAQSRDILITLKQGATAADAQALQKSDPSLANATWRILIATDPTYRPQEYTSKPRPPSDSDVALWSQIIAIVGAGDEASGSTQIPAKPAWAETEIQISLPTGRDGEPGAHQTAISVADLLPQFGHPVGLRMYTSDGPAEIIVGGCWHHEPDHRRLPLEVEMSRRYEKC